VNEKRGLAQRVRVGAVDPPEETHVVLAIVRVDAAGLDSRLVERVDRGHALALVEHLAEAEDRRLDVPHLRQVAFAVVETVALREWRDPVVEEVGDLYEVSLRWLVRHPRAGGGTPGRRPQGGGQARRAQSQ
jgi:hypothetical protein